MKGQLGWEREIGGEGNRRRWNLRIQDSALRSDRSNRERGQLYNFTP